MEDTVINRLILNDGSILADCECGYYEQSLWCYLRNLTFADAFRLFSAPGNETKVIYEYGTSRKYRRFTYAGFTEISAIEKREFTVDVRLKGTDITIQEETIEGEVESNEENQLESTV